MDEIGGVYPINMLINDSVIDMREESSIIISAEDFGDFSIEIGDESLDNDSPLVGSFNIGDPYPNPFNGRVSIPIKINQTPLINFNVYNINGKMVYNSSMTYPAHTDNNIFWNGKSNSGNIISSGTYLIKIINGPITKTKKIIYIK